MWPTRCKMFLELLLVCSALLVRASSQLLESEAVHSRMALPDNILTAEGEVAVDPETGEKLPEEMNDGELEGGDHHISWNYHDQNGWAQEYPLCDSSGMRQSPIDIVTSQVIKQPQFRLQFIDYDQEVELQLKNTHHSVSLMPIPALSPPSVKLNWINNDDAVFELQDIHFHWGDGFNKGSEHEINGQRAAAEMHLVHYKKGIKREDIGNVENSVVVVGIMIESDDQKLNKLDVLVDDATKINGTDQEVMSDNPANLINLLPEQRQVFFTYNGSLTTPPCYEVVTWIVMSSPIHISNAKLIELSNIEAIEPDKGKHKIASNHRDVQPLLNRPVYTSSNTLETSSAVLNAIKDERFSKALDEYWNNIKNIHSSARRAFSNIRQARSRLLSRRIWPARQRG